MSISVDELRTLGNTALLRLPQTAFFCSREYPPGIERLTYLWALEQRYLGRCVLSGFHSRLEQAVFRYLRQDVQHPIVYALGRGVQPALRYEYGRDIGLGRLLFVTPFEPDVTLVTPETAEIRNLLLADLADQLFIPYVTPGGNLDRLLKSPLVREKPLLTLNLPCNKPLLRRGAQVYRPAQLLLGHTTKSPFRSPAPAARR